MERRAMQNGRVRRAVVTGLLLLAAPVMGQARPGERNAAPQSPSAPSSADRQKAMQADMDRLLQLARNLKSEVDSARKDELSMKVIRDADEIDKLARSARGRIR